MFGGFNSGSGGLTPSALTIYRPYRDTTFALSTIYVSTLGNDVTGDGSIGNPYATIAKAVSIIPVSQATQVVIQLVGVGPYDLPTRLVFYNNITIQGEETVVDTRAITAVTSASNTNGIVFTVGGAALTANQWKGRHLHVTGALSGGRNIICAENTVANLVSGPMYLRASNGDAQESPAGGSVDLIQYTELRLTAATIAIASTNLNIQLVKMTGNFSYFSLATDKVNIWKSELYVKNIISGRAGGTYVLSSTIGCFGDSSSGVASCRNGGDIRFGFGTLLTDINSGANVNFFSGSASGIFTTEGGVVWSNLDSRGIELDNVNMFSISQANLKMVFEKYSGASSNAKGFVINSLGGIGQNYSIAESHGGVLSTYFVEAENNAHVKLAASTSVTTSGTTNAVSADGGTTNVSLVADGTRIDGGVPLLSGVLIPQEEYDIIHDATAANFINRLAIGISGLGAFLILNGTADDFPPILGNDEGELATPACFPFLTGDLIVTEENTLPVNAVQLYARITTTPDAVGSGRQIVTLYAESSGSFQDEYGRIYNVYETATPGANPEMLPLYVNPADSGGDEAVCCPDLITDDGIVCSAASGYFLLRGNANTLPLYFDPTAADPALRLFYDNAGSGVDVTVLSGAADSTSGSTKISSLGFLVTFDIYFYENQTDVSKRFFHRSPFFNSTVYVPIGSSGKYLEVQYDGTGLLGVLVYGDGSGFPAILKANLPSAADKTFKTCSTRKQYQSNLD